MKVTLDEEDRVESTATEWCELGFEKRVAEVDGTPNDTVVEVKVIRHGSFEGRVVCDWETVDGRGTDF